MPERVVARVLLVAGTVLALASGIAWWLGGGVLRLGPLTLLSMQRPLRALALALGLLLLAEALRGAVVSRASLRFLALLAAFFAVLVLDSRPRIVGDGQEYLAMAWNLAHGRPPGLDPAEQAEVERAAALRPGELALGRAGLVGFDRRQDFHHFWLYSLLVAPFLAGVTAAGGPPLAAFAIVNTLLLLLAAAVVQRHAGPAATLVLFAGPLVWWLDKPHPESFLVTLVAGALVLARDRPELALPLLGLAAAQNPVFGLVLGLGSLWTIARLRGRPFLVVALAGSWALALANPLYYLWHLGRAVPLRATVLPHVPNLAELRAVFVDPNLGLLPAWPSLGVAVLLALVLPAGGSARRRLPWWDVGALALGVALLAVVFTQPGNINHGGTRGMSRYGLWLAPFALPALARLGSLGRRGLVCSVVLAGWSLASAIPEYLPYQPERYLEPTPLAAWLWTRHPGLDRPLPEVFAERAWGYPPRGRVPTSTLGCEQALVRGDGRAIGRWPLACAPAAKPPSCREPGVLCYAARRGAGYGFARAPGQPTYLERDASRWYWSGTPSAGLAAALGRLPWKDYVVVAPEDEGAVIAARWGVGRIELWVAEDSSLAWLDGVRKDGAWLTPVVTVESTALVIDPLSGEELSRLRVGPASTPQIAVPRRAPLLLVVAAAVQGHDHDP